MEVKVKLFATLRDGRGKIVYIPFFDGITPAYILKHLNIRYEDVAILLVNGRDGEFEQKLLEEDYLSVFPPVGGG